MRAKLGSLAFKCLVCGVSLAKLEGRKALRITAITVSSTISRSFVVGGSTWFCMLSVGICLIASAITIQESLFWRLTLCTAAVCSHVPISFFAWNVEAERYQGL